MKKLKKLFLLVLSIIAILFVGCSSSSKNTRDTTEKASNDAVKIILDTDFGDDGDDLLSLVMLHHMQDYGECEIIALGQANSNSPSAVAMDIINTYYGRPDIPIGIVKTPIHGEADQYGTFLIENYPDMYDLDINNIPDVIDVYRKALAEADDKSIVLVVIGFKQNMNDLLKSKPDKYSSLNGVDLVAKKVKFVSDMGGFYPRPTSPDYEPFNFGMHDSIAKFYIENCPVPIIFTGTRTGEIKLAKKLRKLDTPPGRAIEQKLAHDGGWGKSIEDAQAAFDCVSTLVAVRGADEYFNVKYGCNEMDFKGFNVFNYDKDCGHSHIDCKNRKMKFTDIENVIEEMLIAEPKNKK